MRHFFNKAVLLSSILLFTFSCTEKYDFHITNARIITVNESGDLHTITGDLLIRADTIAYVGEALSKSGIEATRTIDAEGKVVSPGFIDLHTHGNPLGDQSFENFLAMGVTTIVSGQDGYNPQLNADNPDDLRNWLDSLEAKGTELNVAMLAGHGTLRRKAGIPDDRNATEEEIQRMSALLERGMEAGAFGLSTGLEYVPGISANQEELNALAKATGAYDGIVMSHMRSEDDDQVETAINELLTQGQFSRVHVSHIKVVYGKGAARGQEILKILEDARESGIEVSADVYPYMASYTGIGIVFPDWAKSAAGFEKAKKERLQELRTYLDKRVKKRNGPEAVLFGTAPYAGKTLGQVAAEAGKSYVDVLMEMGPGGASGAYFIMDEELQKEFIKDRNVAISTDGSPTIRHPRGFGSFAKIIAQYVEQEQLLNLEDAVYKMALLPAEVLKLKDRGTLKVGNKADLLIFDPTRVRDYASYVEPYLFAEGFDLVMVNGKVVREDAALLETKAGQVLRRD